jgi:sporulation protein YlmC with PRC-barrel domain
MDIPVNAQVHCADGPCGRSSYVILNPTTEQITHLVVREAKFPHTEVLVPVSLVVETTADVIQLRCTTDELRRMEPFIETEYIQSELPEVEYPPISISYLKGEYLMWPYFVPDLTEYRPVEHKHIPPYERAVHRDTRVNASDGYIGQVDEFLVDPASGHITHLVLTKRHLLRQEVVTIPVSQIDHIEEDTVYLKLDRHSVEALPAIPVRKK